MTKGTWVWYCLERDNACLEKEEIVSCKPFKLSMVSGLPHCLEKLEKLEILIELPHFVVNSLIAVYKVFFAIQFWNDES